MSLTSRQVRTLRWLLDRSGWGTLNEAARDLRLSPRVVRSGLDAIERFVTVRGLELERRRGVGVRLTGPSDALVTLQSDTTRLEDGTSNITSSARDRFGQVRFLLLSTAPEAWTIENLQDMLGVSTTSARRDLARAEEWLADQDLVLSRRPGHGVTVVGTETAVRRAFVKLLLELIPSDLLSRPELPSDWWKVGAIGAGLRFLVGDLPIRETVSIVHGNEALRIHSGVGNPWLAADLAIIAYRIRAGRPLQLEPGILRSLADHPVWETAEMLAAELAGVVGFPLAESEIGGLTEHLLGMAELREPERETGDIDAGLAGRSVQIAAERLHPGLADDAELVRSLSEHIERLRVRLRYGLPVHNPLLSEVMKRYPEVHATALLVAQAIGDELGTAIADDEAGFITMYLSGSLERLRLRPRSRAIVVCPAGMATAWILVSRIQSEFPELDLVEVVSAGAFEERAITEADIIISTIPLEPQDADTPVVVVSPMLPPNDVRRVARCL